MTAIKTNLYEVDASHTPFRPTANIAASNVQDAINALSVVAPLRGSFSLTTNSNTTALNITGLLSTSEFSILMQNGALPDASQMFPWISISAQVNGTITLSHPQTALTLNYNYLVQI